MKLAVRGLMMTVAAALAVASTATAATGLHTLAPGSYSCGPDWTDGTTYGTHLPVPRPGLQVPGDGTVRERSEGGRCNSRQRSEVVRLLLIGRLHLPFGH